MELAARCVAPGWEAPSEALDGGHIADTGSTPLPDAPLTIDTTIDEIVENFSFLDDWEDRYGYLIELGRALAPLPEEAHNTANKVNGCVSQVWVEATPYEGDGARRLRLRGDSDAHIVRGLVAIALALYSGRPAAEIAETDAEPVFREIGLADHLTPQRANGLRAMVARIREEAREAA